jgi:predicted nucleotidyltransferase
MYQDYKDLLSAFQSHGVKYLVVGGFAVIYYAQPRFTKDIDLFIQANPENAQATYAALAGFGAPLQGIRPEDFTDRNSFFRFGRDPKGFDILPSIPGVDFDAAWERRVEVIIDTATGLRANFISVDDLIASKLATGRMRDLADVEDIRKAVESQRPTMRKPATERS